MIENGMTIRVSSTEYRVESKFFNKKSVKSLTKFSLFNC